MSSAWVYVRWEICEQNISTSFRVWEHHRTKHSNRVNYRSIWSLQKDFFKFHPPLPPGFPESLSPPLTRISTIPSVGGGGGGGFFLEQPNQPERRLSLASTMSLTCCLRIGSSNLFLLVTQIFQIKPTKQLAICHDLHAYKLFDIFLVACLLYRLFCHINWN